MKNLDRYSLDRILLLLLFVTVLTGQKEFKVWTQVSTFLLDHFHFSQSLQQNYGRVGKVSVPIKTSESLRVLEKVEKKEEYKKRIKKMDNQEMDWYRKMTRASHFVRSIVFLPLFKIADYFSWSTHKVFSYLILFFLFLMSHLLRQLFFKQWSLNCGSLLAATLVTLSFFMNGRLIFAWLGVLCLFSVSFDILNRERFSKWQAILSVLLTSVSSGVLIGAFSFVVLLIFVKNKTKGAYLFVGLFLLIHGIPLLASIGKVYLYHKASGQLVSDILGHGLGRYSLYAPLLIFVLVGCIYFLRKMSRASLWKKENYLYFFFPSLYLLFGIFGISTAIAGLPLYITSLFFLTQKLREGRKSL